MERKKLNIFKAFSCNVNVAKAYTTTITIATIRIKSTPLKRGIGGSNGGYWVFFLSSVLLFSLKLFHPLSPFHSFAYKHAYTNTDKLDKQRGLLKLAYAFAHFIHHSSLQMLCCVPSSSRFSHTHIPIHPSIACVRSFAFRKFIFSFSFFLSAATRFLVYTFTVLHTHTLVCYGIAFCTMPYYNAWHVFNKGTIKFACVNVSH